MAESKRIFNQAKINRDLDARLLPPGVYRDGLNVNVGESEGGDIGAVENLKGNKEITGQTDIEGVTIGSVRDPNNDRIYWFNKGENKDSIYEYDESTGEVNPILIDSVSREKVKPKCAPNLTPFLDLTPDDPNNRPNINIVFIEPVGGCTDSTAFNYNPNAEFNNGTCVPVVNGCTDASANNYNANANTDNGSCTYDVLGCMDSSANNYNPSATVNDPNNPCTYNPNPVPGCTDPSANNYNPNATTDNGSCTYTQPTTLGVTLTGGGSTVLNGSTVTIGANVSNAIGSISYNWGDGSTGTSTSVTGSNGPVGTSLTITDAGRTSPNNQASDSTTTTFQAAQPVYWELNASSGGSVGSNLTVGGEGISNEQGTNNVSENVSFTATISVANGYEWVTAPTRNVSGLPSGVTASAVGGGTQGSTAPASVLVDGPWTPTQDETIILTWSGGSARQIPAALTVSLTGGGTTGNTANSNVTIGSNVNGGVGPYTYNWGDGSSGTSTTVTGAGTTVSTSLTVTDSEQNQASANTTTGFAAAAPPRRSVSISSYGGVTTSAQCASRSTPITVYFSNTSSPYTGVRNGDTLYTSATGSSTYSSGSGYKTYVADGYGQAPGVVNINNGVVSGSNTSFC